MERELYDELIDPAREVSADAARWHRVATLLVVALGIAAGVILWLVLA